MIIIGLHKASMIMEFEGEPGVIYRYYSERVGLVKDETISPEDSSGGSVSELVEYKIKEK